MRQLRPAIAVDPRLFGRGMRRQLSDAPPAPQAGDDVRLFATTFLAGFIFVSVFLA